MTKRTKRKALELCKEHWMWMAKNPGKRKQDWPKTGMLESLDGSCFACEYNRTHKSQYCGNSSSKYSCIIPWNNTHKDQKATCWTAEYHDWSLNPTPENALAIVALTDKALAKLKPLKHD